VIFGGAGDLSWRKLLPALYNLNADGLLPVNFAVVGFGRGAEGEDADEWFRRRARDGVQRFSRRPIDEGHWVDFARAVFYVPGNFDDLAACRRLKDRLGELDREFGVPGSRVYYLAVPPELVPVCADRLRDAGLVTPAAAGPGFSRVILEKPIGHDLASAGQVMAEVARSFSEDQTYRIDHYLGKEAVQNLLVLRFANSIFEPLWNQKYIDHVQITVAEEEGLTQYDHQGGVTGSRIGYYEGVGALRDMVQNHLLQALCMTAMEPPYALAPDVVRDAKVALLRCLRRLTPEDVGRSVVRGQYVAGEVEGRPVPGYLQEVRDYGDARRRAVRLDSTTETYVALRLFIDNWRWAGVPFYLRTGKRLPKRVSEVAIQFKDVPQVLFNANPEAPLEPTVLSLRIQPDEGMALRLLAKLPGPRVRLYPVKLDFHYRAGFGDVTPEAYERLLLDVVAGDATLFMRRDAVEAAWEFVTPILEAWAAEGRPALPVYQAGTWGPAEADDLMQDDGRRWRVL
jgi:glucose-6-phosphate 1-dehydrogenase